MLKLLLEDARFTTDYCSQVPVIILSGVNNSEAHAQCLEAGAEDYLVKPFNPKELLLKIQKILQNTSTNETLKNTSLS